MATAHDQQQLEQKTRQALEGETGFVPMEPAEEQELGRRARAGDGQAAWTLVMANQNFVRSIARRYRRDGLSPGMSLEGPAVITEDQTTTIVGAGFDARLDALGYIRMERRR